jgi:molybdopterin molybdotransferase
VIGLPGNPVSAMVTFEVFVKPGLRKMLGHATPYPELLAVTLEHAHEHTTGRLEFARARLHRDPAGRLLAQLHSLQGSGSLPSMAGVDALVLLDADRECFSAGDTLHALPLHGDRFQPEPPYPLR